MCPSAAGATATAELRGSLLLLHMVVMMSSGLAAMHQACNITAMHTMAVLALLLLMQIAFTGSTEVGRRIASEVAQSLKPCTLMH
jgi:acyl-CoA reductase-like NAD-dependent aldehyde dehydrogenase